MTARNPTSTAGDCTCLRIRKAARRVSQIYDTCLVPHGLTITQFGLLAHVRRLDGTGIGALAEELVMDPTTLTRNVRPLVQRGLMLHVASPTDRRVRALHLTQAGRDLLAEAAPAWRQVQDDVARALGRDDSQALAAVLDRLQAKLS